MSEYRTFTDIDEAKDFFNRAAMENRRPTMKWDSEFGQWEITADPKK